MIYKQITIIANKKIPQSPIYKACGIYIYYSHSIVEGGLEVIS